MKLFQSALVPLFVFLTATQPFTQELPPPPTAPEPIFFEGFRLQAAAAPIKAAVGTTQFSVGDPTDEEQQYLEYINRARQDAVAEAERLIGSTEISIHFYMTNRVAGGNTNTMIGVDTNLMKAQFATNLPVPPLSFNAKLINAARGHTQYQFDNGVQVHDEVVNGATIRLGDRLMAANYGFWTGAENVYSYAKTVEIGHAGFEVDWSNTYANGGMQTPPGHRNNIHNRTYTEVGIGVILGTNKVGANPAVGPMLVTQDFGLSFTNVTYITGVAYYDINGNNFYDLGEGLGGIRVDVAGRDLFAITSRSGAYSIPVPPGGTYDVTFSGPQLRPVSETAAVNGTNNFKLDFKPAFVPAAIVSQPSITFAGVSNLYNLAQLPGATGYKGYVTTLASEPLLGAEGALTSVTISTFSDYPQISSTVKASGTSSFHLAHRSGISTPGNQNIRFNDPFYVKSGAHIDFKSRLGISSPSQVARVEVSEDSGTNWSTIWSQAGVVTALPPDTSEQSFNSRSVSLDAYAGKQILIRFNFTVTGSFWPQPANGAPTFDAYGWYIDDISVVNAAHPSPATVLDFGANGEFRFVPPTAQEFLLNFQAVNGTRLYPKGPNYLIAAQANPPVISLKSQSVANGSIQIQFEVLSGPTTPFALDSAPTPLGPWTRETAAVFTGTSVKATLNGDARFYRVAAN